MAASTTLLAWGAADYKDGYQAAGQYQQSLNTVRWDMIIINIIIIIPTIIIIISTWQVGHGLLPQVLGR